MIDKIFIDIIISDKIFKLHKTWYLFVKFGIKNVGVL
jgi:hypothetical protein